MGKEAAGLFGNILHSYRSWLLTDMVSLFPMGEKKKITAQKGSFGTELCPLGGRQDMGKVKLLFLAFFSASNLGYF